MYEYLEEHAYISKNKKSNYQFELTQERAECIANKHNSLCEEKDKEIERLNNIINEIEKEMQKEIERTEKLIQDDYEHGLGSFGNIRKMLNEERKNWLYKIKELKGDNKE